MKVHVTTGMGDTRCSVTIGLLNYTGRATFDFIVVRFRLRRRW